MSGRDGGREKGERGRKPISDSKMMLYLPSPTVLRLGSTASAPSGREEERRRHSSIWGWPRQGGAGALVLHLGVAAAGRRSGGAGAPSGGGRGREEDWRRWCSVWGGREGRSGRVAAHDDIG